MADYDAVRVEATTRVVLTNRQNPPDTILREVYERSGDNPFERIEDVISRAELEQISNNFDILLALKSEDSYGAQVRH